MAKRRNSLRGVSKIRLKKSLRISKRDPNYIKNKDLKKVLRSAAGVDTSKIKKRFSKKEVKELLNFYNAVIKDGRYIANMQSNPAKVARKLKIRISKNILKDFQYASSLVENRIDRNASVAVVAAAVIVIVLQTTKIAPGDELVLDRSGIIKL